MGDEPFGLLELGSNSLKSYLVRKASGLPEPVIKTHKSPWRLAHDFFRHGSLSDESVCEIIERIREIDAVADGFPLSRMLAVATGVFREIPNVDDVADRVKNATGVRVRVISGEDEARLMANSFREEAGVGSTFLFDLGGATTEWAWIFNGVPQHWGSLPLGAIRHEYLFRDRKGDPTEYLARSTSRCDEHLNPLPFNGRLDVVATGGTAKAVAGCYGEDVVPLDALRRLMEFVLRMGSPERLKLPRREVFLPGLVVLWRVLVRCKAPSFRYGRASVRDGMATRLIRLLNSRKPDDLHATLLLRPSGIGRFKN